MEPIRILHITGAMNRGGQETLIMELYRHIDRSKVQFDFLLYNYFDKPGAFDDEIVSLGGKIYNAKRRFYKNPIAFYGELKSFFREHPEYRIVHSHQFATSGYMLAAAKKETGATTVAHSHIAFVQTDMLRSIADSVGKRLLSSNADYCFGCSDDAIVELMGTHSDGQRLFVMKNAIEPSKFKFDEASRLKWRERFSATADTLVLGNVARFTRQKNHEQILTAFSEVQRKQSNSMLILAGVGQLEDQTKALAKELGIESKIRFMGSRDDVNEIINAFDVFLMPSRYEGLGIVLIEAQANGLPCVISADVIPEEADVRAGLVTRVSLDDPASVWADAVTSVAGKRLDPELAQEAVKKAGYDINEVAAELQEFYLSHA